MSPKPTINKLEAFIDSDVLSKLHECATSNGIHQDELIEDLLRSALTPVGNFTLPVTEPAKIPLPDAVTAEVADFAAASGISFDLALASLVSTGIGYIRAQAATAL